MKIIKYISIILVVLIAIVGFAIGVGFLGAFIQDKLGGQFFIYVLGVLVVASLLYLIKNPKKSKPNDSELLRIGTSIFQNHTEEFVSFYNLYLHDKKKFLVQKEMEEFDLDNLRPIDVLYIFGASKNLVDLIDWRGEEYEGDIETFIEEHLLKQKHTWTNASKLRLGVSEQKQRDGKFIVDLFKSIDKDLQMIHQRMLFFDLGSDAYAYTTLDTKHLTK